MAELLAFHNDPKIKTKYLRRVRAHQRADQIVQRYGYWKDGRGCAIGCTLHGDRHSDYETELGIPQLIARLEDRMFESLPKETAREWPAKFLAAIPVGANLGVVWPAFAEWLLVDSERGVFRFAKGEKTKHAITGVSCLYHEWLTTGKKPDIERWRTARYAANAADTAYAAAYAAYAANAADAANAAAYAAYAAADAAAYAVYAAAALRRLHAANAADAAADAAAYAANAADAANAARKKFWVAASEKLLELLSTAK